MMAHNKALLAAILLSASSGSVAAAGRAAPVPLAPAAQRLGTADELIAESRRAMPTDPVKAREQAGAARAALATEPPSAARQIGIATAAWLEGEASIRLSELPRAQAVILAALRSIERAAPNSKLHGSLLSSRAGIEAALGRPLAALNDYQRAYAIFHKLGEARDQAIALQNIGSIYNDAADYERVLYYYGLAHDAFPDDPILDLSSSNNQANALDELGRFALAEQAYGEALRAARRLGSPPAEARILDNLAQAQLKQGHLSEAAKTVARGLSVARDPRAADSIPLLMRTAAQLALANDRPRKALDLVERSFAAAGEKALTTRYRELHHAAYLAYKRNGQEKQALDHFETYKGLSDQGRSLAASTSATLAAARFDFANQNARIATLKTGQLQRDIALSRLKARQLQIVLGGLLTLVTVVAVLLGLYLRSLRRSRDAIGAVNLELVDVNHELEAALLAKTQFLATTSHEIRTPLNGVLGMTQVLLADPAVVGDIRERIMLMHKAGGTMQRLVDDILDSAKTDAGSFDLDRTFGNLHELLSEGIVLWRAKAEAAGLTLRLDIEDCPEFIVEDMGRLRQIVFNIVANAIKFTPQGRIDVKATTATIDGGDFLKVIVSDTGIGIAQRDLGAIFERFVQLDGSTTRQFAGTGLGLAICRNLARTLDGDVLVTSEVGVGSQFTVLLPLRAAPVTSVVSELSAPADTLEGSSLLIVRANPLAQAMFAAVLKPIVARLAFAASMDEAVAALPDAGTNLILLEGTGLAAETGDGLARLRDFAAGVADQGACLVVLWPAATAGPGEPDPLACGANFVIRKPVGADSLVAQLRAAVSAHAQPDALPVMDERLDRVA